MRRGDIAAPESELRTNFLRGRGGEPAAKEANTRARKAQTGRGSRAKNYARWRQRWQGQMVRRSDHCLPSDSDKFTIKLHSLPSKFPSSALLRALLPSEPAPSSALPRATPVAPPSAPQKLLPLCGHVGAPSEEPVLYSSAITITLCTPAPPFRGSLPVSPPAPLRVVPPVFRPSRPSRRHFPSLFVCFGSLFSLPRLFPSLRVAFLPHVLTDRPVASTAAIPQLFSSFLALVAIAARRGTPHASRYRACFTGISLSLCFLHSLFLPLLVVWCSSVGIYFSTRRIYFQAFPFFLFAFFYSPK